MSEFGKAYVAETKRPLPTHAAALDDWLSKYANGDLLPPRSVQAVSAGLVAHALTDSQVDPSHFHYYNWVMNHLLAHAPGQELSAQLIGMAFIGANIFQTDLPQPLSLNPWQVEAMYDWPLATQRAVIIENNGVFIWLHHLHPSWPLINQEGNDFQSAYVTLMQHLVSRGLQMAYLGDLDATGIRIADTLDQQLPNNSEFLAIQTPAKVFSWLSRFGKLDVTRTAVQPIVNPDLAAEMNSVVSQGKFVEQEQLLSIYEHLIPAWLEEGNSGRIGISSQATL